jgi:hypothetical protein
LTTGEDSILLFGSQPGIGEILELSPDMIPCDDHRLAALWPGNRATGSKVRRTLKNSAGWVRR